MDKYFIGVDVGTTSVRAGIFTLNGSLVKSSEKKITIFNDKQDYYEQSSDEIWNSCCSVIHTVTQNIKTDLIGGIGFDATCSMVVLDSNFQPVAVNSDGCDNRNVIMWLDHRASAEAREINCFKHNVLKYVGGEISLEMQPPKLLWLKKNLNKSWQRIKHFFDLPDFLTYKATESTVRSLCSITCKWTYTLNRGWEKSFWDQIGLEEIQENNFEKIGNEFGKIGQSVANGISANASKETGLNVATPVAVSILDAHCGGIGTVLVDVKGWNLPCENSPVTERLAIICGTSTCHMASSKEAIFVPGVWGPYESAMLPDYWLNEGGQSAVGNLLDHIVESHPAYTELKEEAKKTKQHVLSYLNDYLSKISKEEKVPIDKLSRDVHVLPDYHGNRSPIADPTVTGLICGLTLDVSLKNLALLYLSTIQSLANCTAHIVNTMVESGHKFSTIFMTGGLTKNQIYVKAHANATGLPVVISEEKETVLLGGAILGACAGKAYPSVYNAIENMSRVGQVIWPDTSLKGFYQAKYQVLQSMYQHQKLYKNIMSEV